MPAEEFPGPAPAPAPLPGADAGAAAPLTPDSAPPPATPIEALYPSLAASPSAASYVSPPPLPEPPPLRGLDVLMGLGLVWPVECALLVCVGVASLLLTKAGVRSIPGWDVHPIIMSNHAALSAAWTCAVVWFLACHLKRRGLDDGLALRSPGRYWAVWSTLLGVGMAMAGVAVSSQWGREDTTIARMGATPEGLACLGALAMFMAPVEEVYYRGFVFPGLRRSLGAGWAGAIVVTWFASIHVLQLVGAGGFDAASLACVAAAGTVFTVVRQRTDSLLPPIAVHFAYNTTLVAVSALSMILEGAG